MKRCAYSSCGVDFAPRDPRQKYCTPRCFENNHKRRQRAGRCAHCEKPIVETDRRFCDQACRWSYQQERRGRRGKSVKEPVAVLLPLGCKPSPVRSHELPGPYGEVARKVFCQRMERCLSFAIAKNWGGMSCQECDVDETAIMPLRPKGSNWSW